MKTFTVILAALFALASMGQAFAFDNAPGTNAQVYFAIPFGATGKADATPRFGFSVDYGKPSSDHATAYGLRRINSLDFRLNIAGDATVYGNGVNLSDRLNALYAADDENIVEGWIIPLSLIGALIVVFAAAKEVN